MHSEEKHESTAEKGRETRLLDGNTNGRWDESAADAGTKHTNRVKVSPPGRHGPVPGTGMMSSPCAFASCKPGSDVNHRHDWRFTASARASAPVLTGGSSL